MTILRPRGKAKSWYFDIVVNGIRVHKGGFKTKAEALGAQEEKRRELKNPQTPTVTDYSFREVANEYLDHSKRRFSDKNYHGKTYIFRCFQVWLGDDYSAFKCISARQLESYLSTLPRNTNFNRHRKALCSLFAWARKRGLIEINPCIFVDRMPESQKRKAIPSQEEMARILLSAGSHRPFFICLFGLAARLGEINNLRWEDVNFDGRIVTLWTRKGTGEIRPQKKPMNEEVFSELSRLYDKRSTGWVFPNPKTGEPYRNRRAQIRSACLLAGCPYYPWHSIRHYVASLLADSIKASLPTIAKMLGHQKVSTTARYIQSLGQDVVEAAEMLTTSTRVQHE